MSTLAGRKEAELAAKRQVLVDELAFWRTLTARREPLEKHQSQLERIDRVLAGALGRLETPADVLGTWAATTEQLLGLHHVWDFFRSKLALRLVERFRAPLAAADELAWACAQPFYAAALAAGSVEPADVREPALVYFDAGGSPFALARNQAYRNLLPAKRLDELPSGLLRSLPVPVIAIPWHQQAHFAETAIVAHENAHLLDDDLDLVETLRPELEKSLDPGRVADWSAWLPEVIADVLGALQLGPAYGQSLVDVLATGSVPAPGGAVPAGSLYPPARTRVELVAETLRSLGHTAEADAVVTTWTESQPGEEPAACDEDVAEVVRILALTPIPALGNTSLQEIDSFTPKKQTRAVADADRLQKGIKATSGKVRELVAAGVIAFATDPTGFFAKKVPSRVLDAIEAVRAPGTRAGTADLTTADEGLSGRVAQRDDAFADQLVQLL